MAVKPDAQSATIRREWLKCAASPVYFTTRYVWIYRAAGAGDHQLPAWTPFTLWPAQVETLARMAQASRLVVLKARQLGLSWLALAYALWLMAFRAPATILLFSLKEAEAVELLGRLRGMYVRLPGWMQARGLPLDSGTRFELSTGSRALAFSTRGGRSYSGSLAIVDEADFIPNLALFLNAVKPTVDGGGQLFLISTSDKRRPVSPFKNLFRAAALADGSGAGQAGAYQAIFLPWQARPDRDAAWHARTKAEMLAQRGTDDDFYAEYPATSEEALAPESLDRRLPYAWIEKVLGDQSKPQGREERKEQQQQEKEKPFTAEGAEDAEDSRKKGRDEETSVSLCGLCGEQLGPALPGLEVYVQPQAGRVYVIGADPAEGNPHSDESAATVLDALSGEEAACLAGRCEPTVFAGYLGRLARWYNGAAILPERNNHGHTVIAALREAGEHRVLCGYDGKLGWLSNVKGKVILYNQAADAIRDQAVTLHSRQTAAQLASIEASTLRAPAGLHDDRADSFALAVAATAASKYGLAAAHVVPAADPLAEIDSRPF